MCRVPFDAFFPFWRKSPGLLNVSYGSTEKADQKFHEKMPVLHRVAADETRREHGLEPDGSDLRSGQGLDRLFARIDHPSSTCLEKKQAIKESRLSMYAAFTI